MGGSGLPLVSIIMPAYNIAGYIRQSIESVLASDYPNFELIVVDDGSKDNTLSVAREYEQADARVKVLTKANGGQGIARNFGVEVCNGKYILFVDSDDLIGSSYVSKAVAELQATFDSWTADDGKYATHSLTVAVNNESVMARFAEGYLVRAVIASAVLVVLAFAYVALRYNWRMGLVAAISVAVSVFLASAIVVLTRIPTSASIVYAVVISALASIITVLFNLNKLRAALRNDNAEQDTEKLIVSSVAVKEIIIFTAILGAAVLLVGIPAGAAAAWFALCSFIGVAVAAFVGLIYAPALCLPMQKAIAAKEASATKYGYKGAKKGEKPAPKAEPQKEEVKEEPKKEESAPVEKVEEAKADEE
jgi:glycosyltransferase involved in cell wall biosynthesis